MFERRLSGLLRCVIAFRDVYLVYFVLATADRLLDMDPEREVKRATRDLSNLLTGIETPLSRLEAVQNKYTELLGRMKRLDQENAKNKKRGDLFQKEKEAQRTELTKTVSMKEKLEKLCRELTKENKKVKVRYTALCSVEPVEPHPVQYGWAPMLTLC